MNNSKEVTLYSAAALSGLLESRQISAVETTQAYLEKISQTDQTLRSFITVTADEALQAAHKADQARAAGQPVSPLCGVPAGIKDNICTKGVRTTCASRMLEHFEPPFDATVITRLRSAGVGMLGKCNMDEFAMGSSTETSYFGVTRNPLNIERVAGGSSGGSAAAVAANQAVFTLGSDTGGSIRQPAAFCGVVGLKPTYGSVSRYGLVGFASSLDQIGPITRDVRDAALVLDVLRGHDPADATCVNRSYGRADAQLERGVAGMRLALPSEFFGKGISPAVRDAVQAAAACYESMGAHIVEVSLPSLQHALPAYYVISSAEASSNLARFDGIKFGFRAKEYNDIDELYRNTRTEGFGPEVKRRIMLGAFALSAGYYDAYYQKAMQVRTMIIQDFNRIFEQCDLILSPVSPTTAYRFGEKKANTLERYMGDMYTVPVNIAGLPSLSMPCGVDADGLPVGLQLIGPTFSEETILRVAYAGEQAFHARSKARGYAQ